MSEPLIIFKATGETRYPVKDVDWIQKQNGTFKLAAHQHQLLVMPIYERIEIAIPEGATTLDYRFGGYIVGRNWGVIELSRPKVKKWLWCMELKNPSEELIKIATDEHYSEEELKLIAYEAWSKVEESEVSE
jgi:hypothetical protein